MESKTLKDSLGKMLFKRDNKRWLYLCTAKQCLVTYDTTS